MEKLTNETLETLEQATLWGSTEYTCSPGSEPGTTPLAEQEGEVGGRSPAPAPRSQSREKKRNALDAAQRVRDTLLRQLDELASSYAAYAETNGLPTSGIYGRKCGGSSVTDGPAASTVSRFGRTVEGRGSPLYALRWKFSAMPVGDTVYVLQPSARRIYADGSTFTGWPTPQAFDATNDGQGRAMRLKKDGNRNPHTMGSYRGDLKDYAPLAGWPAPMAGSPGTEDYNPAGNTDSSRKTVAMMDGWITPQAGDYRSGQAKRYIEKNHALRLNDQCELTGWATPRNNNSHGLGNPERRNDGKARLEDQVYATSGPMSSGYPATTPTEQNSGQSKPSLNPSHSRFLMRLPDGTERTVVWPLIQNGKNRRLRIGGYGDAVNAELATAFIESTRVNDERR